MDEELGAQERFDRVIKHALAIPSAPHKPIIVKEFEAAAECKQ